MAEIDCDKIRKSILEKANDFRSLHSAKPLEFDDTVNTFAQEWATTLAKKNKLEHRKIEDNKYGESLFVTTSLDSFCPIKLWGTQAFEVDWNNIENKATQQFTQLVWNSSKKLGIGIAKSSTDEVYIVCNYEPCGNVSGKYADNVKKRSVISFDILEWRKTLFNNINDMRKRHHADPLEMDNVMNAEAQSRAEELASKNKLETNETPYGYHLTTLNPMDMDALRGAKDEEKKVDWKDLENPKTQSFTRVVWKGTKKFGVGLAKGTTQFFVVQYFSPQGNVKGQYKENVFPSD